jgi:cyclopropane fatty-acyl-phospholipid synthase-like methyltransferase
MSNGTEEREQSVEIHHLYEQAVQEPDGEVEFVAQVFQERRGRPAVSVREDFCGTALFSATWVQEDPRRTAIGVDLDADTLDWSRKHRIEPLGAARERVQLICADVREVEAPAVDVVAVFNFSYSLIHERRDLLTYFKRVRSSLSADGLFVLDFHAGPRSQQELFEETDFDGFTYVWEQGEMDAISGRARRAIHFVLDDGREFNDAFAYEFRVWTVPELRDLLDEAGFSHAHVYFEDFDKDGYSLGAPERVEKIAHEDSWIGYLVAEP